MRGTVVSVLVLSCLLMLGSVLAHAETLTIGGTGSSGPLVKILFEAFQAQESDVTLLLIDPPLGSNGALRALDEGRIDLAVAGRPLAPEEIGQFGRHFDLADTPFVFVSKDESKPEGFTLDELAAIYDGTVQSWPSGKPIRVLVRNAFESDTLLMKTMSENLSRAVDVANDRPGMSIVVNDIEAVLLLSKTPSSLGPTTLGLLSTMHAELVVFPLEGVAPSVENLCNGSYPWHKRLTIIMSKSPSAAATRFVDFLFLDTARLLMEQYDYLPVQ